ncbi:MAG: hypothetical protein WEB85_15910 [Dongiaceae bacterium]
MKRLTLPVALILFAAGAAGANEVPDLRGTWVAELVGNDYDAAAKTFALEPRRVTFVVDRQEGGNFSGAFSTETDSHAAVGSIHPRTGQFVVASGIGFSYGTHAGGDELDLCYARIGQADFGSSCATYRRQR